MDQSRFQTAVKELYRLVSELESMFPGRPFTPDGHLVGSLGECLVAEAYDLKLLPPSNKGFDAKDPHGREVEIKATQATAVAFRSEPEYCIVIKLLKDGTFQEIFNGPGHIVWSQFSNKKLPSNGQYQISLAKLMKLQAKVAAHDRIGKRA